MDDKGKKNTRAPEHQGIVDAPEANRPTGAVTEDAVLNGDHIAGRRRAGRRPDGHLLEAAPLPHQTKQNPNVKTRGKECT